MRDEQIRELQREYEEGRDPAIREALMLEALRRGEFGRTEGNYPGDLGMAWQTIQLLGHLEDPAARTILKQEGLKWVSRLTVTTGAFGLCAPLAFCMAKAAARDSLKIWESQDEIWGIDYIRIDTEQELGLPRRIVHSADRLLSRYMAHGEERWADFGGAVHTRCTAMRNFSPGEDLRRDIRIQLREATNLAPSVGLTPAWGDGDWWRTRMTAPLGQTSPVLAHCMNVFIRLALTLEGSSGEGLSSDCLGVIVEATDARSLEISGRKNRYRSDKDIRQARRQVRRAMLNELAPFASGGIVPPV